MASGATSGSKTFTTGFTPVEIVVYNDSPADIYYADGLFSTKPGATIRIPPNTDMPIPYTQNAQGFTLFWESTSTLTQTYQIIVKWSNVPLAVPYTPLTQQVSVADSVTISVTQSGNWTIDIGTMPNVNINGPITVEGVTGGTAIGVSISSSVALNVQQSGTWTVSISNQPTVNVNGPVSVQGVTGGTAIGVSISSSVALNVQQSGTWTVDINTMPTVNINGPITVEGVSGGTAIGVQVQNDVTINGTVTVQFPSAQEVTLAATGPVSITDPVLSANVAILPPPINVAFSVPAAGDSQAILLDPGNDYTGLYDGFYLRINSPSNQVPNLKITINAVALQEYGLVTKTLSTVVTWATNNDTIGFSNFIPVAPSTMFSAVDITVENTYQGDTETLTFQLYYRKASNEVTNLSTNPVQQQAANGSYANLDYTNGGSAAGPSGQTGSSSETATIFNAGGYAASLTWDAMNFTLTVDGGTGVSAAFSLTLFFGGAIIATVGGNATLNAAASITLPAGTWQPAKSVSNSGVTVQAVVTVTGTASGVSGTFNWAGIQMVYESVTPPVEVTSVA